MLLNHIVHLVRQFPSLIKLEPAQDDLQADMVFLHQHDAHGLVLAEQEGAGFAVQHFRACQMLFVQRLFIDFCHRGKIQLPEFLRQRGVAFENGGADFLRRFFCLFCGHGVGEGVFRQVPRQPYPGADHDIVRALLFFFIPNHHNPPLLCVAAVYCLDFLVELCGCFVILFRNRF